MAFGEAIAKAFRMDDAAWRRHANPWSGWTRLPILPLLALAIWSRVWLGWWCLVPIGVLILWAAINPHVFPVPKTTDNWMSHAVFGERVWLNRDAIPIPQQHRRAATLLTWLSAIGLIPLAWGFYALDPVAVVFGVALVLIGKLWFLDRMVWLYADMREATPEYRSWST